MVDTGQKGLMLLILLGIWAGGVSIVFNLHGQIFPAGGTPWALGFYPLLAKAVGLTLMIGIPWVMYHVVKEV